MALFEKRHGSDWRRSDTEVKLTSHVKVAEVGQKQNWMQISLRTKCYNKRGRNGEATEKERREAVEAGAEANNTKRRGEERRREMLAPKGAMRLKKAIHYYQENSERNHT